MGVTKSRSNGKDRPRKAIQSETFYDHGCKATQTRKYTTIRTAVNGKTKYHKVQLRTEDDTVVNARATALTDVDDPAKTKRRTAFLADAGGCWWMPAMNGNSWRPCSARQAGETPRKRKPVDTNPKPKTQYNSTDPESKIMKVSNKGFDQYGATVQPYAAHIVVRIP